MTFNINLMFCALVLLTGSSHTAEESSPGPLLLPSTVPSSHVGTSATPNLREKDPGHEVPQQKHNLAGRFETSAEATAGAETEGTVRTETMTHAVFKTHTRGVNGSVAMTAHTTTVSPSAAAHSLSSTPMAQSTTPLLHVSLAEAGPLLTGEPLVDFSSQRTPMVPDAGPTAPSSSPQSRPASVTTVATQASAAGWGKAGPTHWEVPSELNVGDEDSKGPRYRSNSPLDPLLAALLSVFIVTTAIVFVALFLKFRQRTNHPEFHRLQDLPMDDLMEDTPLSRYSY